MKYIDASRLPFYLEFIFVRLNNDPEDYRWVFEDEFWIGLRQEPKIFKLYTDDEDRAFVIVKEDFDALKESASADIAFVYSLPHFRHKGIATQLLEDLGKIYSRLTVHVIIPDTFNDHPRRFWVAKNFLEAGRRMLPNKKILIGLYRDENKVCDEL